MHPCHIVRRSLNWYRGHSQLPSGIITVQVTHFNTKQIEFSQGSRELTQISLNTTACVYVRVCVREREGRGLAGLRVALSRLGGGNRRRKVKIKVMEWWQKMVFPVRRAWCAFTARVKTRKNGDGLLKLRDDIQTCGYEDVQIMWDMLRSETENMSRHDKRKNRWFWRNLSWSNRQAPSFVNHSQ
ncbi:uncharacterized protein LOC111400567 [Olea europaea var. sylvestris]|uniref:uncharacterized protein LOC111400567 n=1 Tax=Olea europaea var. sylvestris TaxID=158386 RepID=UPI000C1CE6B5|nr:uncharacterized protein LOC111400567 [Olea europaea var. sylvestris]